MKGPEGHVQGPEFSAIIKSLCINFRGVEIVQPPDFHGFSGNVTASERGVEGNYTAF